MQDRWHGVPSFPSRRSPDAQGSPLPRCAIYEERGLIASARARSGHRRYPRAVLRRIAFIVFAQRIGLSPRGDRARSSPSCPSDRTPARQDWARISGAWTKRIDERIAELQRLRAGLTQCIGCGCLSIDKCQCANPADRAGRKGPGPRYWMGWKAANLAYSLNATYTVVWSFSLPLARTPSLQRAAAQCRLRDGYPPPHPLEVALR